ncbi:MAG: FtsX-like permease family protein [Anaerolineae bacterium]
MKLPRIIRSQHLWLMGLRHTTQHPFQGLLLILGIALGVAVIIGVDLANSSAGRAFQLSTESVAGRATHRLAGSAGRVPVSLYRDVRVDLGLRNVAPVVEGIVALQEADGLPLRLLGVDPFAEAPFRSYFAGADEALPLAAFSRLLLEPGTVVLSEALGARYGLAPGDALTLRVGARDETVTLLALVAPADAVSRRALDGLVLADISTAQELLGLEGYLSHIDFILDEDDPGDRATMAALRERLPPNLRLERTATRNETIRQLTAAFNLNLTALSLLTLVVGAFLIYNTINFSVMQRRAVLGTLRCLGVTRREIFGMVLSEGAVLSILGAIIGVALGIVLGRGLVGLVTRTVNDLYFTVTVRAVEVSPLSVYKGVLIGLAAGLAAALVPALEATSVPPQGVLRRSVGEERVRRLVPWLSLAGIVLGLAGWASLLIPSRSLILGFGALFAILIGFALLTPAVTIGLMRAARPLLARVFGVLGGMASRDIVRSLSRTSVAIAALMVSVSVIVGIGLMIGSFRSTVVEWLDAVLQADIYIAPAGIGGALEPDVLAQLDTWPGVAQVARARRVPVHAPDLGEVDLMAVSDVSPWDERRLLWSVGSLEETFRAFTAGGVLVSEPFAFLNGLPRHGPSRLVLTTESGPQMFDVVGVYYDYNAGRGVVLMDETVYRRYWDDPAVSSVAVYVDEGVDVERLAEDIRAGLAGQYALQVSPNRSLRQVALDIFDQTFTVTSALRLLATVVAFIGILSALMSLQLERTRELGTLRANGMTLRQLWSLTLLETGLMGLVAGLLAIPTGLALALVLIYVINLRSFGWSLQLQLSPGALGQALLVAVLAALLAGVYPALRMGRLVIAEAVRQE